MVSTLVKEVPAPAVAENDFDLDIRVSTLPSTESREKQPQAIGTLFSCGNSCSCSCYTCNNDSCFTCNC